MSIHFRELKFGIEIECTGDTRIAAANVMAIFFDTGKPTQISVWGINRYRVTDQLGRVWEIVKDASIEPQRRDNGDLVSANDDFQVEVVSPVLNYTDIPLLQELVSRLRKEGFVTNRSCGIHIHIGAEHFSLNNLRTLCNIVYAKQSLLFNALNVNPHRRQHCMELSDEFIQKMNKKKPKTKEEFSDIWYSGYNAFNSRRTDRYNDSRYRCLNLHQLLSNRYMTVEFRFFNSYLHAGKVKAYIQLSLLIVSQALNQKKATSRPTKSENGNDKYTMRVWLLRMCAISNEFKTMRKFLLKHLDGNAAWRNPPSNEEAGHQIVSSIHVL